MAIDDPPAEVSTSAPAETSSLPPIWPTVLRVSVAVPISVLAVLWVGMTLNDLDRVALTREGGWPGAAPSSSWAWSNGLLALALALWVCPAPVTRLGASVSAGAGAAMMLTGLAFLGTLMGSLELADRDNQCVRADCWPQGIQELLALTPAALAALALVLQSALPPRWSWWGRAIVPVGVLVVATLIQLAVWSDLVIPLLQSAPG